MKGQLFSQSGLSLSDLLQVLCLNGTTACLKLSSKSAIQRIDINILDGKIINAECSDGLRDADAMVEALSDQEWEFELLSELSSDSEQIEVDSTHLLMECTVRLDESKRGVKIKKIDTQPLPDYFEKTGVISDSSKGQDMVLVTLYAERMSNELGLGSFRYLVFEENESLVAIWNKGDKMKMHTFRSRSLNELGALLETLEAECG